MPRGSKPGEKRGGRKPGVPNKVGADVKAIALTYTQEAIQGLVALARSSETPPAARVTAWDKVLDRAVGKAPQAITGDNGGPIEVKFRFKLDRPGHDEDD